MRHNKRALVDVDGVCGDFLGRAKELIYELFALDVPEERFVTWDVTSVLPDQEMRDELNDAIAKAGFATWIKPFPEAVEAIREIRSMVELRFVTSPHKASKTWMRDRHEWLMNHFDAAPEEIVHCFTKHEVVGGLFLDDKPEHVRRWKHYHPGRKAMLWDCVYNRGPEAEGLARATRWEDVIQVVRGL